MINIFKHKKVFFGIIAGVVVFFGYQMFFTGEENDASVVITGSGGQSQSELDILRLLADIRSVNLNHDLLETAVFLSLEDYSVFIEEGPTGRRNPFAPIDGIVPVVEGE
ncbi:MAG: hypothetical protein H8D63_00455 [Parcubacteria group bacterium]|nr:hypothetical protein [Parcubacteria group bacterium]